MEKINSSNMEQTTEKNIVYPLHPHLQVFPPTTVRIRGDGPSINLPRECRDVRYISHLDPQTEEQILFVPVANQHPAYFDYSDHEIEVVPTRDGYRTYAPMPAGTEGIRYRRVIERTTGIVMLTPINRPQSARRRKKAEEKP